MTQHEWAQHSMPRAPGAIGTAEAAAAGLSECEASGRQTSDSVADLLAAAWPVSSPPAPEQEPTSELDPGCGDPNESHMGVAFVLPGEQLQPAQEEVEKEEQQTQRAEAQQELQQAALQAAAASLMQRAEVLRRELNLSTIEGPQAVRTLQALLAEPASEPEEVDVREEEEEEQLVAYTLQPAEAEVEEAAPAPECEEADGEEGEEEQQSIAHTPQPAEAVVEEAVPCPMPEEGDGREEEQQLSTAHTQQPAEAGVKQALPALESEEVNGREEEEEEQSIVHTLQPAEAEAEEAAPAPEPVEGDGKEEEQQQLSIAHTPLPAEAEADQTAAAALSEEQPGAIAELPDQAHSQEEFNAAGAEPAPVVGSETEQVLEVAAAISAMDATPDQPEVAPCEQQESVYATTGLQAAAAHPAAQVLAAPDEKEVVGEHLHAPWRAVSADQHMAEPCVLPTPEPECRPESPARASASTTQSCLPQLVAREWSEEGPDVQPVSGTELALEWSEEVDEAGAGVQLVVGLRDDRCSSGLAKEGLSQHASSHEQRCDAMEPAAHAMQSSPSGAGGCGTDGLEAQLIYGQELAKLGLAQEYGERMSHGDRVQVQEEWRRSAAAGQQDLLQGRPAAEWLSPRQAAAVAAVAAAITAAATAAGLLAAPPQPQPHGTAMPSEVLMHALPRLPLPEHDTCNAARVAGSQWIHGLHYVQPQRVPLSCDEQPALQPKVPLRSGSCSEGGLSDAVTEHGAEAGLMGTGLVQVRVEHNPIYGVKRETRDTISAGGTPRAGRGWIGCGWRGELEERLARMVMATAAPRAGAGKDRVTVDGQSSCGGSMAEAEETGQGEAGLSRPVTAKPGQRYGGGRRYGMPAAAPGDKLLLLVDNPLAEGRAART